MRYVYVVKSGAYNSYADGYQFGTSYCSSVKMSEHEVKQILAINRASEIKEDTDWIARDNNVLRFVDYVGEEGRYKARIIVERHELKVY
jgi:galactose-1-phosphate uridylyltransferase